MDVVKSGPKPEGHSLSKHLNGRSEAACLSVIDTVGGEFLKVKSIEACIYIRPEAPQTYSVRRSLVEMGPKAPDLLSKL